MFNLFAQSNYVGLSDSSFAINDVIELNKPIRFIQCNDWSNQIVDDSSHAALDEFSSFLTMHPNVIIEIGTHTDLRGSVSNNDKISMRQAELIREILLKKGVDSNQLSTRGYGESSPLLLYLIDDSFQLEKPETTNYELITLNEDYINQFRKTDIQQYEKLHILNRRIEFKIVEIK